MTATIVRAYRLLVAGLCIATSLMLVAIVGLVLVAVLVRYFGLFPGSLHWVSELTRFAIIWVVMLGAAIGLDRGAHVAIDFTDRLPPRLCRFVRAAAYLLGIVFIAALVVYGFQLSSSTMRQLSPALKLPVGYAYMAIPVGAAIMLVQSVLFALLPHARAPVDDPLEAAVTGGP